MRIIKRRVEIRFVRYKKFEKIVSFPDLIYGLFGCYRKLYISANSPTVSPDFNRNTQQRLFTGLQSPTSLNSSVNQQSLPQQQFYQAHNNNSTSISAGPPTTGLFDCIKSEKSFQTPLNSFQQSQNFSNVNQQQSFLNSSGFNQSHVMSPISSLPSSNEFNTSSSLHQQNSTFQAVTSNNNGYNSSNFWVTVFGFPQSAISAILSHFSQCGSILEKVCSSGNWIHLRFSSRLECDKALLYNGKIISNNLMIGVARCTDESITDKENSNNFSVNRIRSLTQSAYKSAQEPTEVVLSPNAPKRSTGIVNRTLDMFFGW